MHAHTNTVLTLNYYRQQEHEWTKFCNLLLGKLFDT